MALAIRPALPARSPEIPSLPFKVTTPYARLLASTPDAEGMELLGACALHNMVAFVRSLIGQGTPYEAEYRHLLRLLEFASDARGIQQKAKERLEDSDPLRASYSQFALKRLARRTLRRLEAHGTVLVPCFSRRHAMYLQISREPGGHTLRIYNTGDGIGTAKGPPRHTPRGANKWQSMYVVREVQGGDGPERLNEQQLLKLLWAPMPKMQGLETVEDIYAWADALGRPDNPPRYAVQALQKSGTCTHKSVLAVARNLLTDVAYCELLARLREQAYANYVSRGHRAFRQPLIDLFAQRVVSARDKADRAHARSALRERHAQDGWMVESTDREAMDRALLDAREAYSRAFLLSYRDDTHQLALSTVDHRQGLRHAALVPRAGTLATPEANYADLSAAAQHWKHRGYVQIGRAEVQAAAHAPRPTMPATSAATALSRSTAPG